MILIIDDDAAVRSSLTFLLKRAGFRSEAVPGPKEALEVVRATAPELILMDMNFTLTTTGEEGIQLLRQVKIFRPDVPVILMTAWGSISLAVQGMQAGAFDFITKPWNNLVLLKSIRTALELSEQKKETNAPLNRSDADHKFHFDKIVGQSAALMDVLGTVSRIAPTNASVLITGESGTGKDLVARLLRHYSPRRDDAFVTIDLGSIPEQLFESELFGYEKGAFTDARRSKSGRMEMASGGTLFLDEIGNLSLPMQSKLLTAIEKRHITRLGAVQPISIDVRLICATNANLRQLVGEGSFRQDLLYRINTIEIAIPPLRERGEDILMLADHFQRLYSRKYKKTIKGLSREAGSKLMKYPWPGNVRELQHVLERAVILNEGTVLRPDDFPLYTASYERKKELDPDLNLEQAERKIIERALRQSNGNMSYAAELLGITRFSLYRKIEKFGL